MVTVAPKNLGQQVAMTMGWDGSGQGAGGHNAWVAGLTPQQRAAYNSQVGSNAMSAPVNASALPALQEPLHQWEKAGLTGLSNTGSVGGSAELQGAMKALQQMLGGNYDFFGQANTATQAGAQPITAGQIQEVANPYADAMKSNLSATAQKLRAQLDAGQGTRGARSFGDTATGVRQGDLDKSFLQESNAIDYQAFDDARAQLNADRNRSLSAGGQFGNLGATQMGGASTLAGVASGARNANIQDIMNQLQAGAYTRDYNQGVNDVMRNDIMGEAAYPSQQLASIMQLLQNYQSGGQYTTPGKTSSLSKISALLNGVSGTGWLPA